MFTGRVYRGRSDYAKKIKRFTKEKDRRLGFDDVYGKNNLYRKLFDPEKYT